MHGHPYWPGKVIGLSDSGNNKIDVRFFGTHDRQNILISDCLLFSDNPNKRLDQELEDEIDAAMKVRYFHERRGQLIPVVLKLLCLVHVRIYTFCVHKTTFISFANLSVIFSSIGSGKIHKKYRSKT